jgi:bacteriorhodopsin
MMNAERKSLTLTFGWLLLLAVGLLITLGGLESLYIAYFGSTESIAGVSMETLAQVNPELPKAIRGRRATAACYAVSMGTLLAWVAATAFRRRQKWAWYALLCAVGAGAILSILRIPLLDYRAGAETAGSILVALILALAVSYRDFK